MCTGSMRSQALACAQCCSCRGFTCSFEGELSYTNIPTYMSLVSCLPALETVDLCLPRPLVPMELGCLLNALSWLPRLQTPDLSVDENDADASSDDSSDDEACPDTSVFAKLRSLTKLALSFCEADTYTVAGVVDGLVSLTGLAVLNLGLPQSTVVPAALGQLKGLRSLVLSDMHLHDFEADCLNLPNLVSLDFSCCNIAEANMPPGVTALQNLTSITFAYCRGPRIFHQQPVRLPRPQHLVYDMCGPGGACQWLSQQPVDMGALTSSLLHLTCSRVELTQFPLVLTQLAALRHLNASETEISVLPSAITALSRLTELVLGRRICTDVLQQHNNRPMDVRALGDLSGFPALCRLAFHYSEVVLCDSMLGAVRHASPCEHCICGVTSRTRMRAHGSAVEPGAQAAGARQRAQL